MPAKKKAVKKPKKQASILRVGIPKGTIVAYYSKNGQTPPGWVVCDGEGNNTPNLRGMFILGARTWADVGVATKVKDSSQPGGAARPGQTGINDDGPTLASVQM